MFARNIGKWLALCLTLVALLMPAGVLSGHNKKTICLRNCHLCKGLYGQHFHGHLCAQTCVKLGGRITPDCTDLVSIAPFLRPIAGNHI